jgi:Na+-transporting NADH:ubiquinone oxidoreductase subunit C
VQSNTNNYTIIFMAVLTVIMALLLALAATGLKPRQDFNVAFANKQDILGSVGMEDRDRVLDVYESQVEELVIDHEGNLIEKDDEGQPIVASMIDHRREVRKPLEQQKLPIYKYTSDDDEVFYIVPVRGSGLWNEIWGFIALEEDLNTIAGASFGHAAETPGLGAVITDDWFQDQFIGKKIRDDDGEFVSIYVRKGGARDSDHEVDGLTGATVTADGVTDMLKKDLKKYLPFFDRIKADEVNL